MDTRHNLNRLSYFIATVDEGTITAAADRLGISKAVVSKQLQLLEKDVGVTLLMRNTRKLQLTDAGRVFYDDGKAALIQANQAYETVMERDSVPKGKIRITAPVDFGLSYISPLVARFCQRYPEVEVDLFLSDEQLDIIENRYDLAFRVGWLKSSNYLARKLLSFDEVVVCSPATAKQAAVQQPQDLTNMPFVTNRALKDLKKWVFQQGNRRETVELTNSLSVNITLAIRDAVLAGDFFSILPDFLIANELAEQKMIRLLPKWSIRTGGVYIVSPPGHLKANAVRTFIEMTRQEIASRFK